MKKSVSSLLLILSLFITGLSSTVNAALMNVDALTVGDGAAVYDDATQLTWLDLTLTYEMSYEDALLNFSGYRYATNSEIEDLFLKLFPTYSLSTPWFAVRTEIPEVYDMVNLFGFHDLSGGWETGRALGLYKDENDLFKLMGSDFQITPSGEQDFSITGPSDDESFTSLSITGSVGIGTFLVKNVTSVPEPNTILLFCLAVLFLKIRSVKTSS